MKSIYKENRPWGAFHILAEGENYKIKKIIVNPGKRMSYQFHNKRSECWIIIEGTAKINLNEIIYVVIISLLISFIASFLPAWKASKSNPIDLIRKE